MRCWDVTLYRILWTRPDTEGGWWNDIDAADAPAAVWEVATNAGAGQDGRPPVLVSVSEVAG